MTNLGMLAYFPEMEFKYTTQGILIRQKKYTLDVLKRYKMLNCNVVITPANIGSKLKKEEGNNIVDPTFFKQMVGCLICLSNTRLDIAIVLFQLASSWKDLNTLISWQ